MLRYVKEVVLLGLALGLLLLSIYWLRPATSPQPKKLRMTAGDATGLRHQLALEFAREARIAGIEIDVIPTSGSQEAIEGLTAGKFDLAFAQGGLATEPMPGLLQLTPLHIEPLHLVVDAQLAQEYTSVGLDALRGKTVNLGSIGSGTYALASEVLSFAGIELKSPEVPDGFVASTLGYSELLELPIDKKPDAIFTVSSLPSPLVDKLVEQHGFRLIALPFAEAMTLEARLQHGQTIERGAVNKHHVFEARIPA